MNRTTTIASKAAVLALLAMPASAASLAAQELRIAVPVDELGFAAGSQVEGRAASNDIDLFSPPLFVEPPASHAAYWEEARIHPVLRPPVILSRPEPRYALWWDSIETVLGLRGGGGR